MLGQQPLENKTMEQVLKEAEEKLVLLRKEVNQGDNLIDLDMSERAAVLVQIKPLIVQLQQAWDELDSVESSTPTPGSTSEEERKKQQKQKKQEQRTALITVAERLKKIVINTTHLNITTDGSYHKEVEDFNFAIDDINARKKVIEQLLAQYQKIDKNIQDISRLEFAKNMSIYMTYATAVAKAITTIGLAWMDTLAQASQQAGLIFYPITATLNTITALFRLGSRGAQYYLAYSESRKEQLEELRQIELARARRLLAKSIVLRSLVFTLNLLSILAFAGVLATPVGWVFVAASTFVDWLDKGIGAYIGAKKTLNGFIKEYSASNLFRGIDLSNASSEEVRKYVDQELKKLSEVEKQKHKEGFTLSPEDTQRRIKLRELKEHYIHVDKTRNTTIIGFANTVAMVMIACGPLPGIGPLLGLAGLLIMGSAAIGGLYIALKPHYNNYFHPQKAEDRLEAETIELQTLTKGAKKERQQSQELTEKVTTTRKADIVSDEQEQAQAALNLQLNSQKYKMRAKAEPAVPVEEQQPSMRVDLITSANVKTSSIEPARVIAEDKKQSTDVTHKEETTREFLAKMENNSSKSSGRQTHFFSPQERKSPKDAKNDSVFNNRNVRGKLESSDRKKSRS